MRAEVETFLTDEVPAFTRELAALDARIDPSAEAQEDEHFDQLSRVMWQSAQACRRVQSSIDDDPTLLKEVRQRFQQETAEWFDRSWFAHRSRARPRGFPGDYEMLIAVYEGRPKARGLGGYLDLYLLGHSLAEAVAARLRAARSFLLRELSERRGDVSILNVACGPCREYIGGLGLRNDCSVHITCIDLDQQALDYVQANVIAVEPDIGDVRCARYNALRMCSAKQNVKKFGRSDVICSVGLCDYIPDKLLVAMLAGWRESLNDNGVLYVAFKDTRRYDESVYQWHMDWHFLQRTEEDCRELFRRAGFDLKRQEMDRDATGVIMNFLSRVKRPTAVRVDAPAEVVDARPAVVRVPGSTASDTLQTR